VRLVLFILSSCPANFSALITIRHAALKSNRLNEKDPIKAKDPIISIAVYLRKGAYPNEYYSKLGPLENSFKFEVIKLWEYNMQFGLRVY
jgi:hypothetical protein